MTIGPMTIGRVAMIGALALAPLAAHAGPCSQDIERMQARFDARIEATIDTARFARDARGALGLPAAKPGPHASAEDPRGGSWMGDAVAAMARARDSDRAGDQSACTRALADVQRAIGP